MRQFYGRLEKCVLAAGTTHVHKIPRFRGGVFWVWGEGGSADFNFMGAQIFLNQVSSGRQGSAIQEVHMARHHYTEKKKRTLPPLKENPLENFYGFKEKLSRPVVDAKILFKTHIYHQNLSSVAPIFFGKEKFLTGAGRCMLSFSQIIPFPCDSATLVQALRAQIASRHRSDFESQRLDIAQRQQNRNQNRH